jgi:NADH:ubiquinone reductase (H+-translocating)
VSDVEAQTRQRPRVLVLGGGFGGIGAAKTLRNADVDVVVVDKGTMAAIGRHAAVV